MQMATNEKMVQEARTRQLANHGLSTPPTTHGREPCPPGKGGSVVHRSKLTAPPVNKRPLTLTLPHTHTLTLCYGNRRTDTPSAPTRAAHPCVRVHGTASSALCGDKLTFRKVQRSPRRTDELTTHPRPWGLGPRGLPSSSAWDPVGDTRMVTPAATPS